MASAFLTGDFLDAAISPFKEIAAYEALWRNSQSSFKKLSELFASQPGIRPSDLVTVREIEEIENQVRDVLSKTRESYRANILINGTLDYPEKLKDAKERIELLYYSGNLDLIHTRSVAVVGTRNPTSEGARRAARLVKLLVKDHFTIISGLATGIDTVAHTTAIENGGNTIAVIGTPLNQFYPKINEELQKQIAKEYLLISQVPFIRYQEQSIGGNRLFFPERNKTMSALSEATIIVEAGETSGTLVQARAALQQGRKLFILDSCFQNDKITWPGKYLKQGAIRVKEYQDIISALDV
ncbi:DNA processing protein [Dyadobacter koreensis]|uniref:DNA processing protein n=1 Tax=Dyadobacter koreensis TaxID=408657 RepID=A0A1H6R1T0_9BACT|nr:DNA-processing protein DprA [Dyadobacter koreensis]SEI45710.1 DNA processing protein [Dyadobacter koreensis]